MTSLHTNQNTKFLKKQVTNEGNKPLLEFGFQQNFHCNNHIQSKSFRLVSWKYLHLCDYSDLKHYKQSPLILCLYLQEM